MSGGGFTFHKFNSTNPPSHVFMNGVQCGGDFMAIVRKGLLGLLGLYLAIFVLTLRHGDHRLYPANDGDVTIYVLNNGFHSDLILPADRVRAHGGLLAKSGEAAEGKPWIAYGWGDAKFFAAQGAVSSRLFDGVHALFHPGNPSVVRVFGVSDPVLYEGRVVSPIHLSQAGFDALANHIEASFTADRGAPVAADVGDGSDAFFQSPEHFSIVRLCNNWTADQLAAAGLPTAPAIDGLAPLLKLDLATRAGVKPLKP
jgi:uncharacterized protein (TIGR02117 family)